MPVPHEAGRAWAVVATLGGAAFQGRPCPQWSIGTRLIIIAWCMNWFIDVTAGVSVIDDMIRVASPQLLSWQDHAETAGKLFGNEKSLL